MAVPAVPRVMAKSKVVLKTLEKQKKKVTSSEV